MNILQKKVILPMAAVALVGAGLFGASMASADSSGTDPQASLVQKLADTFHVDKSKVQAVFDQNRADKQANMEKDYEARLTQAVTDGKLTAAQKASVLAEHNKLKAEMDAQKNASSTKADRGAAMAKIRTEGQDWAKQNNIDAQWLMAGGGMRHGHGADAETNDDAPAPSTSPAN